MKKQQTTGDPKRDEELNKNNMEEFLKRYGHLLTGKQPRDPVTSPPETPKSALEDDPRNRAKAAELQLENFEKNRYNRDLQDRLGWKPEEYERFLEAQRKRVEQLQKEAETFDPQAKKPVVPPSGPATINGNSGQKVETRNNGTKGNANGTGAVTAPPGFEDAKKLFEKAIEKIPPRQ